MDVYRRPPTAASLQRDRSRLWLRSIARVEDSSASSNCACRTRSSALAFCRLRRSRLRSVVSERRLVGGDARCQRPVGVPICQAALLTALPSSVSSGASGTAVGGDVAFLGNVITAGSASMSIMAPSWCGGAVCR